MKQHFIGPNNLEHLLNKKPNQPMKNHSSRPGFNRIAPLLLLTPLLLAIGCHREQVQVYNVTSDPDQAQTAAPAPETNPASSDLPPGHPDIPSMNNSSMPAGVVASDVQNASPLTWTTPAGWTSVPPSEMRVASFKINSADGKQADVSVVPLPGMAGGDSPNVNRWRGQVGLPAASDADLQASAENVDAGGQPAQLYDLAGQNPASGTSSRILGVIQHRDGTTWFYKMTGDADLIEQQKPAFIAFLKSLSFAAGQPQSDMSAQDQAALPPGHPSMGDMGAQSPAAGPISTAGQPNWQVPSGWKEVSGGQFLVAKFMLSGDNGATAAVNVSSSAGDGGGLPANVNRWRGQLGLPPESEISTTAFQVDGGQAQLVDISGNNVQTGQPAELVGIIVTQPDRAWFYKLMGDPKLVAAQKDAFTQFVQGVKY
jgi:hypothetical protein